MSNVVQIKRKNEQIILSDGVARPMALTLNSLVLLEEKYGTVDAAFAALEKGKISDIRFILYTAMCDQFDSPEQVGALIDIKDMEKIADALGRVANEDMPTEEEVAAGSKATVVAYPN